MRRKLARTTSLAALALFGAVACASPPGGGSVQSSVPAAPAGGSGGAKVVVDASALEGDRRAVFLQHRGSEKIAGAVARALVSTGRAGGREGEVLRVDVTRFRLRSSQTGLWLGWMAGADTLAVSVSVLRDGALQKQFATDTSTAVAGLIRPGAVSRFDRMVNTIAQRIVAGL